MKKVLILLGIVLFASQISFSQKFNYGGTMGISGHHNFKNSSWNTTGEVCIVCHTPHKAVVGVDYPLWNHEVSSITNFPLYSSASMTAVIGQPDGNSKLCLSCHDGQTAENSFGGQMTGTAAHFSPTSRLNIGSNTWTAGNLGLGLSDDHPISFTYDATLAAGNPAIKNPATTLANLYNGDPAGTISTEMLFSGKMQCCTCHDPHNNYSPKSYDPLLRKDNTGSALCLTCHK